MLVEVDEAEHRVVHRDPFAYCAHPHALALPDGRWLCVFNRSFRRPLVLHPQQDPFFHNVLIRSQDQGRTWSPPAVVPGFGWQGVECAGLTALDDGRLLFLVGVAPQREAGTYNDVFRRVRQSVQIAQR